MDSTEAILLTIDSVSNKSITGRTAIQKIIYFEKKKVPVDAKYKAYHYGPYSAEVTSALSTLVSLNLIYEELDYTQSNTKNPTDDWRVYTYTLTEKGKKVVEEIKAKDAENSSKINSVVTNCTSLTKLDRTLLSYAAKVDYINKNFDLNTPEEIKEKAKDFGWKLSYQNIGLGLKLKERLNN